VDGEAVELDPAGPAFFTADPTGDRVAWVTQDRVLVTYDVAGRRVLDRVAVPGLARRREDLPPIGTRLPVLHVDDDRVVFEADGRVWSRDPDTGSTTRLPGVSAADLLDYHPSVEVAAVSDLRDRRGATRSLAQLELRTDAGTVRAAPGRLFQEGRLSPDGRWFVTSTGYEAGLRTVVLDTRTGQQVRLDLPERMRGAYPDPWGWTGADTLVVGLLDPDEHAERPWSCRPSTGSCEPLPRTAAPVYAW
jgi:hypothetical protein